MHSKINTRNLLKFILFSGFGVLMFLIPLPQEGSFTTGVTFLTDWFKTTFSTILPWVVMILLTISAIFSTIDTILAPSFIRNHPLLKKIFHTTPLYLGTKIVGAIFSIMVVFEIGPEFIISGATGGTMVGLGATLVAIAFSLSFFLPFLTDCGVMEFLGVVMQPLVRPLFKVPGRASVDLITSWFGASNAAVILSREQYMQGFYTGRETAIIMTNFSLVSIPFCMITASTLDLNHVFPVFYLTTCVIGFLLAFIMCRIAPLSRIENTYYEGTSQQADEVAPKTHSKFKWAIEQSCARAETFELKQVISGGVSVLFDILFDLIPIVVAWGTIGLIIAEYTSIFTILSYPIGMLLDFMGVEEAFAAAPATLVGFADMFIPALLATGIESVKTRFIIGVLSLVQIIYLTEVGAIIIKSEVPVGFGKLFIIFLQRTLIALPLITLIANWIF